LSGIDREELGMLYTGGAGIAVGASLAYASDPALGWLISSLVIALGLGYEAYQHSPATGTDRPTGGDEP
jgi:hypothetical protein